MALTDREKKLIKSKVDKFKKIIYDTGAPRKKVLEVMKSELMPLNEIYESYDKQKDKFKGGVPGAVDKFFEKEMKNTKFQCFSVFMCEYKVHNWDPWG